MSNTKTDPMDLVNRMSAFSNKAKEITRYLDAENMERTRMEATRSALHAKVTILGALSGLGDWPKRVITAEERRATENALEAIDNRTTAVMALKELAAKFGGDNASPEAVTGRIVARAQIAKADATLAESQKLLHNTTLILAEMK